MNVDDALMLMHANQFYFSHNLLKRILFGQESSTAETWLRRHENK